jgi:hypothetical protein
LRTTSLLLLAVLGLVLGGAGVHWDLGGATSGGVDVAHDESGGDHHNTANEGSGVKASAAARAAVVEGSGGLGGVALHCGAGEHLWFGKGVTR